MGGLEDILLAVLEFTSLSALSWLAAAVLPWLVHRWFRRPRQTTPWAAVELLLNAMRQSSTRINLQQWLLLAIRTMILVLVALAAAAPVWRLVALGHDGTARTHHILVLDRSYSMTCRVGEFSRWELAQQLANEVIAESKTGDAFSIIGWSDTAENQLGRATFDPSVALASIDQLRPAYSVADLSAAVRAVRASIDQASELSLSHEIVFLTDLGQNSWEATEKLTAQLSEISNRAQLTAIDVDGIQRDNLAITNLTVDPALVLRQREIDFVATLRGFSNRDWQAKIEFLVDGQPIESQLVDLPAHEETEVRFSHAFVNEGSHTVSITTTDPNDALTLDNQRWLVVEVMPRIRVACFAASPGAADDLARALAPNGNSVESDEHSPFEPSVMPLTRLSQVELAEFDAVFLCGPTNLSPREAAQVERYVRQGGGLCVFLGPEAPVGQPLLSLLPVKVQPTLIQSMSRFDPLDYAHPIIDTFRGRSTTGLLSVVINRYFKLQDEDNRTILAFESGDPALVIEERGMGRIATMAIPCSLAARTSTGEPWSSFAVSPSFLPLVRELVQYLVADGSSHRQNLIVGESAVCTARELAESTNLDIQLPTGERLPLSPTSAEDRGLVHFPSTNIPGIYSFNSDGSLIERFAVNLDTRESDLTAIDPNMLPTGFFAQSSAASSIKFGAETKQAFARPLLTVVLILLFLETTLAWLLGRGWQ